MTIFFGNREMSKYKRQGFGGVLYTAKGAFYEVDVDGDLDVVLKVEQAYGIPQYSWIELSRK